MPRSKPHLILLVFAMQGTACDRPTTVDRVTNSGPELASLPHMNSWSPAVSVDPNGVRKINTSALEGCPHESPDGRSLYFASNRDGSIDIWRSQREGGSDEWGEPEMLEEPINSSLSNDFCPTPVSGGVLFFVSTRPGGCGMADIYQARLHATRGWIDFEHLGCEINSGGNEFSPSYVPAGGGMLFFSSNRSGRDEIYVSYREGGGGWGTPELVEELSLEGVNAVRPNVTRDGRVIVFDSNRTGGEGGQDIWMATRHSINAQWSAPQNLGGNVNKESNESRGSLSNDGKRLYFGSNRAGGEGDSDLFVSTRF